MRLVIPYIDEVHPLDARLTTLASFLGLLCEPVTIQSLEFQRASSEGGRRTLGDVLVVNPAVVEQVPQPKEEVLNWLSSIGEQFGKIFVYGLRTKRFDAEVVRALSRGHVLSVVPADRAATLSFPQGTEDICEGFASLSIGTCDPSSDHVLEVAVHSQIRTLAMIAAKPFMCYLETENTEVYLISAEDLADITRELTPGSSWKDHFSRFVPHAIILRYLAGRNCWRPNRHYAALVLDDPLLQPDYGYVSFPRLLELAEKHRFSLTLAFIPHNWHRTSRSAANLLLANPAKLSICYHGNDHTPGEFATSDYSILNTLLDTAKVRMNRFAEQFQIICDNVMVFPQGKFSHESMHALRGHNFDSAVNTIAQPLGEGEGLRLQDLCEPAITKYGNFPLFRRKSPKAMGDVDVAFNRFFGIPMILVLHHEDFRDPAAVIGAVSTINKLSHGVHWASLSHVVQNSLLAKHANDGSICIRAYSTRVRLENSDDRPYRYTIEWPWVGRDSVLQSVQTDGALSTSFCRTGDSVSTELLLAPSEATSINLLFTDIITNRASLGVRHHARAYLRRRMCEAADNQAVKSPRMVGCLKRLHTFLSWP